MRTYVQSSIELFNTINERLDKICSDQYHNVPSVRVIVDILDDFSRMVKVIAEKQLSDLDNQFNSDAQEDMAVEEIQTTDNGTQVKVVKVATQGLLKIELKRLDASKKCRITLKNTNLTLRFHILSKSP